MNKKGFVYACLTAVFFGSGIVINKIGLIQTSTDPFTYTTLSSIFSGLFASILLLPKVRIVTRYSKRDILITCSVGILASGVGYILLYSGQRLTTATNAGFLTALASFFAIPFAHVLIGEKFNKNHYPFVALLFAGTYLLMVETDFITFNIGDIFILGTAIIWGFTAVISKPALNDMSGMHFACMRMIVGALFLALLLSCTSLNSFLILNDSHWYFTSGLFMFFTILFLCLSLKESKATLALLCAQAYPIISVFGSVLFLEETLSVHKYVGGVLIIVSLFKILSSGKQHTRINSAKYLNHSDTLHQ